MPDNASARLARLTVGHQFVRYALVGGLAFVVDFATLYVLTDFFLVHYLISATVGFLLGLATNYALCVVWIFDYRALQNKLHEFTVFSVIGLAGLVLNNGVMYLLTDISGLHYLGSKLVAAALGLVFNFALRRQILFTERRRG